MLSGVHVRSEPMLARLDSGAMRFNCRRILPFSRIFKASGDASRRLQKVGARDGLGIDCPDKRFFFTSITVAFFVSGTGIREAVLMLLESVEERLPGLGLEKLAGDGLCGRESARVEEASCALLKSVKAINLREGLVDGLIRLPSEIPLRREAWRIGKLVSSIACFAPSPLEGLLSHRVFFTSRLELSSSCEGELLSFALAYEVGDD